MERLYHTATYKLRFQPAMKRQNPVCQRIVDGEQCHNASTVLHHVREPQNATEFYDPCNCAMLCAAHHPGGRPGTPEWQEGIDYVPTNYRIMGQAVAGDGA
jgi:hypothetical protein